MTDSLDETRSRLMRRFAVKDRVRACCDMYYANLQIDVYEGDLGTIVSRVVYSVTEDSDPKEVPMPIYHVLWDRYIDGTDKTGIATYCDHFDKVES